MTKTRVVCTVGVAVMALQTLSGAVHAQTQDFSQAQVKTNKVTSSFYTLDGAGGTIGVFTGPDGVLMVDSQYAVLTDKIVAAIKQISDGRIRFLIDTHVHGDHTGGNVNFGKLGVTILAREPLRSRLITPNPAANGTPGVPTPPEGLPVITYEGPVTFHLNGEDVRLIPVPAAHTDGDTMVWFPKNDVLMCGDFYRSIQYPNIDRANGGSLKGMLDGLDAVIKLTGPATKIVPGHGPTVDRSAIIATREMIVGVRDTIAPMVTRGMTVEQVTAAKPTAAYDAKISTPGTTADRFVGQVYAELKGAR
jgi:cyclase